MKSNGEKQGMLVGVGDLILYESCKVIELLLEESRKVTGEKVLFEDCLKIEIKNNKVIASFDIPEIIELEETDVTDVAIRYIERYLIVEIANDIKKEMGEENE